jgi:hypothetical protein
MNKNCLGLLAAVTLVLVGSLGSVAAEEAETTTLNGAYIWAQGNADGELEVIFSPTGEAEWDVSFNFTFRNKPHTYTGSAAGKIGEGAFSGTVVNESKRRTFTFEGSFEDGVFMGTHAEVHGEKSSPTGTLTFK